MFDGIKRLWKDIVSMFDYTEIKSIFGSNVELSESMVDAINTWKSMMNGSADWVKGEVKSLRIENGICREFSDAVVVEMEANVQNDENLDKVLQKSIADLNKNLQSGLALGSFILRPLGDGNFEYVTADKIVPISFGDDEKLTSVAILSTKKQGGYYYTRIEKHYFTNGSLTIENTCYRSLLKSHIGTVCNMNEVDDWAKIQPGPIIYPGMTDMDFGYYKNPINNEIDDGKCGVSVFESAKEIIQKADIQAARLDWEYESGERAIHVDDRALKKKGDKFAMPHLRGKLYRGMNLEYGKDMDLYKEFSPDMRDEAFKRGLEEYKREIEFVVGLAYGDLSNVNEVEKTASEIKASKARKYNRVSAIQVNLESCLKDFVTALAFYNGSYTSNIEFNCKFNDSILTDEESERQQDRQDVSMGVMSLKEYRMKWYNEDEATAEKNLPEQAGVME